jgi:hypothetical protein
MNYLRVSNSKKFINSSRKPRIMIGSKDSDDDLEFFLTPEEIKALKVSTLECEVIHWREPWVKEKATFVFDNRQTKWIKVQVSNNSYDVCIGQDFYDWLSNNRAAGTRYGFSAKFTMYDEAQLDPLDKEVLEQLRFYQDNPEYAANLRSRVKSKREA